MVMVLLAQAVYDFLFLLFASSVYSVPALLAPNQVVLKLRESVFILFMNARFSLRVI